MAAGLRHLLIGIEAEFTERLAQVSLHAGQPLDIGQVVADHMDDFYLFL